jgi:hypothetical protein
VCAWKDCAWSDEAANSIEDNNDPEGHWGKIMAFLNKAERARLSKTCNRSAHQPDAWRDALLRLEALRISHQSW